MSSAVEPIRLAFCITDLDPGGAERALVNLVTRLDRSRWQPFVVSLSGSGTLVEELAQADVPVTCLGARNSRNLLILPGLVRRLRRRLREVKPALLQTFLFHANVVGRIAGRLAGVPTIVSGIRVAEKRSRIPLWLDRATQWMVDHHVCVSRDVANFSIERGGLRADKIKVIPNGVDVNRFAHAAPADLSEFGIPADSTTIIFVGRLDEQKGPFILLAAVKQLLESQRNVHVLLVGEGPLRGRLETWVRDHGFGEKIHLIGWRADVSALLKASEILVLPSRWEGMPNVVLEAMAAGLAVVASEVEGTTEIIRNHQTGILVPPESPQDLSTILFLLLNDPKQVSSLGLAAQESVTKDFAIETMVSGYDAFYRLLLHK